MIVWQLSSIEVAVVHDDDWCTGYGHKIKGIIDEYSQAFFAEQLLDLDQVGTSKPR